jgi:hypothetical protein
MTDIDILELEAAAELELIEIRTRQPLPRGKAQRFSPVMYIDRNLIDTAPKTFQGRQSAFAEETVAKIVSEGYDISQEPIVVWQDPATSKYIVISGHSRWQASRILYARGQEDLKQMPVKLFNGTKEEAQEYALLESNRSGTAESFKSDLKAYKIAAAKGYNRQQLLNLFKPESKLRLLQDLALLDPKGMFVEYIGEDSEKSFPYLRRNAGWVAEARRAYPGLTHRHEQEMFDLFYRAGNTNGLKLSKDNFNKMIERKAGSAFFNPAEPLNLAKLPSTSGLVEPLVLEIQEIEREIERQKKTIDKQRENITNANATNKAELVPSFKAKISEAEKIILRKMADIERLKRNIATIEKNTQVDLFSGMGKIGNQLVEYIVRYIGRENVEVRKYSKMEDAQREFDRAEIGDFFESEQRWGGTVEFDRHIVEYEFVKELEEDEAEDDFPLDVYYDDAADVYKELDERYERIDTREIKGTNEIANEGKYATKDVMNEVVEIFKSKYHHDAGGMFYARSHYFLIPVGGGKNIEMRISDHSFNPDNVTTRDYYVTASETRMRDEEPKRVKTGKGHDYYTEFSASTITYHQTQPKNRIAFYSAVIFWGENETKGVFKNQTDLEVEEEEFDMSGEYEGYSAMELAEEIERSIEDVKREADSSNVLFGTSKPKKPRQNRGN